MPFVPTILPALDAVRAIGGILGLRVFNVYVKQRIWAGPRPGVGAKLLDQTTQLVNQGADGSQQPVLVRQVSRKEIFASGGQLAARDLRVGPMTPGYVAGILAAGGSDDATLNPVPDGATREIVWIVSPNDGGTHGMPPGGVVCELVREEATALHYLCWLRGTGRAVT